MLKGRGTAVVATLGGCWAMPGKLAKGPRSQEGGGKLCGCWLNWVFPGMADLSDGFFFSSFFGEDNGWLQDGRARGVAGSCDAGWQGMGGKGAEWQGVARCAVRSADEVRRIQNGGEGCEFWLSWVELG